MANAALNAINNWVSTGEQAPSAPFLDLDETGTAFQYDTFGNVTGGVRGPHVDAPVARLSGEGQPRTDSFCNLFGVTELFDDVQLAQLYPTKQSYIDAIDEAVDEAHDKGFLRLRDADLIKRQARISNIGGL